MFTDKVTAVCFLFRKKKKGTILMDKAKRQSKTGTCFGISNAYTTQ